jgi:hypothetical protein
MKSSSVSVVVGANPSPVPPAPDKSITTFKLTSATTQTVTPFTVGQAFKPGDVPAATGIVVVGATAQVTPKNYWPDGSLKFAIIAGTASLSANVSSTITLKTGTQTAGVELTVNDLQKTGITASISAAAFGTASWSGSDWAIPFKNWISGPQMSSWIYRKPIGNDPHLVGWLEVRLWNTGAVEVLPWIENGYLKVANPTSKSSTFTFTLGGTQRFNAAINLPHHSRTPLVSGSVISYWLATATDVIVKHDSAYLQSSGLVPTYFAITPPTAPVVLALPTTYTPLQLSSWPSGMGSGGYHASIGLLPEWDVLYLTSTASSTYKGVIFNAYSAGRFPYHYRDETNSTEPNRPPKISSYPTLTLMEPSPGWETPPANSGVPPPAWSISHQPSTGFMAYLITGRWYHLDELQMAAATNSLGAPWPSREGVKGIYKSDAAGAARATAWRWRTLAQAASITPDDDTVFKTEFLTNLKNNIEYYHAQYIAKPNNPLGFIRPYSDYNGGIGGTVAAGATSSIIPCSPGALYGAPYNLTADDQYVGWKMSIGAETRTVTDYVMATETLTVSPPFSKAPATGTSFGVQDGVYFESPWMQDFVTAAWGYAKDLGLNLDTSTKKKLDELFTWKAKSIVGRFGATGPTEFLYRDYGTYAIAVSPSDSPDFTGGTGPWYSHWGQVYDATYGGRSPNGTGGGKPPAYISPGAKVNGPIRSFLNPEFPSANALPALAYAVKNAIAGADVGFQRLVTSSNWSAFQNELNAEPVWAIGIVAPTPTPTPTPVPTPTPTPTPTPIPTPIPTPTAQNPKWQVGQAINEWREIKGSAMSRLVPTNTVRQINGVNAVLGPAARMNAWTGLSIDTRRSTVWSAANGGHGDYFGNEVCSIDLTADTPAWVEWFAGSNGNLADNVTIGSDPSHARYKDGLPVSTHSYYGQQFLERQNRALRLGGSTAPIGSAFENVEGFNVDLGKGVNAWDPAGTFGFALGGTNGGWTPAIGWCTTKDPVTENIFVINAPFVHKFTPSASGVGGTWKKMGPLPAALNSGALGATAVDTKRNRILWVHGYGPNSPYTYDIATDTWTAQAHPPSAAKTAFDALTQSLGMVYVPQIDAFLVRANAAGPTVYVINAATFAVSMLPTTGGSMVPQGAPLTNEEGVYNRWLFVPKLNGIVYFPRSEENAWFLRLY